INAALSNNKCEYIYDPNIDLELWKNWKDLYDYLRDQKEIEGKINSDSYLCKIYPHYFSYIKGIYEKYKMECCSNKIRKCPKGIDFEEWCTGKNILTELECKHTQKVPEHGEQPSERDSAHSAEAADSRSHSPIAEIALSAQNRSIHNADITSNKENAYIIPSVVFSVVGGSSVLYLLYKVNINFYLKL
ncbi:hypothetical protein PCYB_004070, partial [Plasmodium cynomolgi strain B]